MTLKKIIYEILLLPDIQQKQEGNLWQLQSLCLIQQDLPVPWTVDHWKRSPSNEISVQENSGHFPPDVYKIHHIAEKLICLIIVILL